MTTTLDFVFFLAALIVFVIATFNVVAARINLIALGLALFVVPFLALAWPGK
jgi:hypothetical protein